MRNLVDPAAFFQKTKNTVPQPLAFESQKKDGQETDRANPSSR